MFGFFAAGGVFSLGAESTLFENCREKRFREERNPRLGKEGGNHRSFLRREAMRFCDKLGRAKERTRTFTTERGRDSIKERNPISLQKSEKKEGPGTPPCGFATSF